MENRRYFLIYLLTFFGIIITLIFPSRVFGYGISTHAFLTDVTFDFYNGKASLYEIPENLRDFLIDGAMHEDSPPRGINHYYDPTNGRGIVTKHYEGHPAKEWASDPARQNEARWKITTAITSALSAAYKEDIEELTLESDFTWGRAKYFYRAGEYKKAMYILGHILHLIQDMSVPAHTRGDFINPFDIDPYTWLSLIHI